MTTTSTTSDDLTTHARAVLASQAPTALKRIPDVYCDANGKRDTAPALPDNPDRYWGTYSFDDVSDFGAWCAHWTTSDSTLWRTTTSITAVINDHSATPEWGDFRATLTFAETPAWKRWAALDRVLVSQDAFADVVEMGLAEVIEPTASDLLELVREFHATADTKFTSAKQDGSGTCELTYVDTVEGRSRSGQITAPAAILLFLPVYEGTEPLHIEARFRFRLDRQNGRVGFGLVFPRTAAEYRREAVLSAAGQITEATGLPVWSGAAPGVRVQS